MYDSLDFKTQKSVFIKCKTITGSEYHDLLTPDSQAVQTDNSDVTRKFYDELCSTFGWVAAHGSCTVLHGAAQGSSMGSSTGILDGFAWGCKVLNGAYAYSPVCLL